MPRPLLLALTVLLGISSIAFALAAFSLAPGSISQASGESEELDVVRRYYEAANHLIATGDPNPLREVVSESMIDLDPPSSGLAGREGIEQQLAFLHVAAPHTRIEPSWVFRDGGRIIAYLNVEQRSASSMLGFALDDPQTLWPRIEVFRVSSGKIVEQTVSLAGLATITPSSDVPFDVDIPNRRDFSATLNDYEPRAEARFTTIDAPEVLRVLSGEFNISLSSAAPESALILTPIADGGPSQSLTLEPGRTEVVLPGTVAVIPPGSVFSIVNRIDRPASLVRFSVSYSPDPGALAEDIARPLQHGIRVESLANLRQDDLDGPALISLGTVSMMPGSRLTIDPATKLTVVCTTNEVFRCVQYESGSERDGLVRVYQFLDKSDVIAPLLLLARESGEGILVNAGAEPATAWVIAVTGKEGA